MSNIAVIGLGKLGSCLAAVLAAAGHTVFGYDLDPDIRDQLNRREAPFDEPHLQQLLSTVPHHALQITGRLADAVDHTDIAMIVVPTPSTQSGEFDPRIVANIASQIREAFPNGRTFPYQVIVCSTLSPGQMDQVIVPALRRDGARFDIAYSPLFIALGSVIDNMRNPDFVLIGSDDPAVSREVARLSATYQNVKHTEQRRMSFVQAELAKLTVNCMLSAKIAHANLVTRLAESFGEDPRPILRAVGADSRIGPKLLNPGGPAGGPCLPRDLLALKAAGGSALPDGVIAENDEHVDHLIRKIEVALDAQLGWAVALLGLSYKPGSTVTDESLAVRILRAARDRGRTWYRYVHTHDPAAVLGFQQHQTIEATIAGCRVVVITTPHPEYIDYDFGDRVVIDPWMVRS